MIKKFESFSREVDIDNLAKHYGQDKIDKCEYIINYIKDILIDLKDIKGEVYTHIDYTPFTWTMTKNNPEIFVNLKIKSSDLIDENLHREFINVFNNIIKFLETDDEFNVSNKISKSSEYDIFSISIILN
jgi:hypothetical protein